MSNCLLSKCYKVIKTNNSISWLEAEIYCANIGGHLPSLNSDIEWKFLHNIIIESYNLFLYVLFIGIRYNHTVKFILFS